MYFNLAVDDVGSWRYNSNIFIQIIKTAWYKLVQKDYSLSFTSRSLCPLLFCKNPEELIDVRQKVKRGIIYCDMIDSILKGFKGEIIRLNVNFCIA